MKLPFNKKNPKTRRINRSSYSAERSKTIYNYRSSRSEPTRPYNRSDDDEKLEKPPILARSFVKRIVLVLILLGFAYLLMLAPNAKVKLNGQPVIARPQQTYETTINQHLNGSIFNYFKLTFNTNKLSEQIINDFPEISNVEVATPLFNRQPKVELIFAEPSVRLRVYENESYILDQEGRALALESKAAKNLNLARLITINDTSNQKVELGKSYLTIEQLNFIEQTLYQADKKKLRIEYMNFTGGASQLEVKYKDANYLVKYSFFADPRLSSGAYFVMRDQLKGKTPPKEYIDLRIPERAYIK